MKPHFFIVRRPGFSSEALAPAVRQTLAGFDRALPLVDFVPLERYAAIMVLPQRVAAGISETLGALALALAAMGLYGLTAFAVSSRTREIGVRIALGASRSGILRLIVWQGARTAAIGGAIGLAMAVVGARLLSSALYGVPPLDLVALTVTVVIVAGVSAGAAYIPARRASALNPIAALRVD